MTLAAHPDARPLTDLPSLLDRRLALRTVKLLSALEAVGVIGQRLPDYLGAELNTVCEELNKAVLGE